MYSTAISQTDLLSLYFMFNGTRMGQYYLIKLYPTGTGWGEGGIIYFLAHDL